MLGFYLDLGWFMLEVFLRDLLDKRYNDEHTIRVIPFIDLKWTNKEDGGFYILSLGWLNLELNFVLFDSDIYYDALEKLIEEVERKKSKEEEDVENK